MPTCEREEEISIAFAASPVHELTGFQATQVAEILLRAAYRVGQPGAWTQHYLGRLADGSGTYARKLLGVDEVRSYCMLGAVYAECDASPAAAIHAAYYALVRAVGAGLLADWNDAPQRTQDEVVAALMRAAEIAEA